MNRRVLALGLLAALSLAACADDSGASGPQSRPGPPRGPVTVFAASSLTGVFGQIVAGFEAENPGTTVTVNYGASSALAQQIVAGAPADVFAAASPATMQTVTDAVSPRVFARNTLEIAVPPGNPGKVTGLADFAKAPLKIALCAAKVPCGAAATKVFAAAGITPAPDTLEQDVKATLSKVELGEVDAALVYKTDVLAAGPKVTGIAFPESAQAVNDYPLAVLGAAPHAAVAQAFVAYVLSPEGQKALAGAGFQSP